MRRATLAGILIIMKFELQLLKQVNDTLVSYFIMVTVRHSDRQNQTIHVFMAPPPTRKSLTRVDNWLFLSFAMYQSYTETAKETFFDITLS